MEPTYKKRLGYQPFHLAWGPYLVDVLFRNGSAHSNHGDDFIKAVGRLVNAIRRFYRADVPIIVVTDHNHAGHRKIRRAAAADLRRADAAWNLPCISTLQWSLRFSHQHKRRPQERMRERNAILASVNQF